MHFKNEMQTHTDKKHLKRNGNNIWKKLIKDDNLFNYLISQNICRTPFYAVMFISILMVVTSLLEQ